MTKKKDLLSLSIAQLNSHKVVKAPVVKNLSLASLAAVAATFAYYLLISILLIVRLVCWRKAHPRSTAMA